MTRSDAGSSDFIFEQLTEDGVDLRSAAPWKVRPKVGIFAAVCGGFFRRNQNPHQPYTPDEILAEATDSVEAGAIGVHVHVRNDAGRPSGDLDRYHRVIDPLRERFGPRVVIDGCSAFRPHEKTVETLRSGLFDTSPVNCTVTMAGDTLIGFRPAAMQAHARAIVESGTALQLGVYQAGDVDNAERYLIKEGLVPKPYFWIILHGLPGLAPMRDPFAMVETLMLTMRRIREIDEDSRVMVCAAGRSANNLAVTAMLLGADIVRVGKEDTIYRWPHRDELIVRSADVVAEMAALARVLGRELMDADEFRAQVGLRAAAAAR